MADGDAVPVAGSEEQKKLEILAVEVLCGFIETVQARQKEASKEAIDLGDLNAAMTVMINSGQIARVAQVALSGIGKELRDRWARHLRKDAFGRILCQPLAPLFVAGKVSRGVHHGVRHFARLVLGDELETALVAETEKLVATCTGPEGVDWDRLYRLGQPILWQFLVRLPAAFRHFDARLNHMLGILNTKSSHVALSANVVVRTGRALSTDIAGHPQALQMLQAWIGAVEALSEPERATMAAATGFAVSFDEMRAELDRGA
jgi:hypothetical protein